MIVSGRIYIIKSCNRYYLRWWYNGWHYWYFLPGTIKYDTEGEEYYTLGTQKIAMCSGQITYSQCLAIRTILNTREINIWTDYGWKSTRLERDSVTVYNNQVGGYEIEFVLIMGSRHISESGYSPTTDTELLPPDEWTSSCPNGDITIGTQVWMSYNYDIEYPGSKVYDNNEANRIIYGGLYTWDQITTPGFCPTGWHVPTKVEWDIMIAEVGGAASAGDKLKAVGNDYWNPVNTGTDDYLFGGRGSGYGSGGGFNALNVTGDFWTATEHSITEGVMYRLWNDQIYITESFFSKTIYLAVRLIRDAEATSYEDWFLPSKDLLNAMYVNLHAFAVGNFANNFYWSSSESDQVGFQDTNAYYQQFNDGAQYEDNKAFTWYVRACRSFIDGLGEYALRDVGPAGGLICHIDGTTYYEAALSDQSVSQAWSNIINVEIGVTAQGQGVNDSTGNTTAIIGQAGHISSAAKLCDDLIT